MPDSEANAIGVVTPELLRAPVVTQLQCYGPSQGFPQTTSSYELPLVGKGPKVNFSPDMVDCPKFAEFLDLHHKENVKYKFLVGRPSLNTVKAEVHKFAAPVKLDLPDDIFNQAWSQVLRDDLGEQLKQGVDAAWVEPKEAELAKFIQLNFEKVAVDRNGQIVPEGTPGSNSPSAGSTFPGRTHKDYFRHIAKSYPGEEPSVVVAKDIITALAALREGQDGNEEDDHHVLRNGRVWMVTGKNDRYSKKKVEGGDGRSIQMPSLHLKILHKWAYTRSDTAWLSNPHYRVGSDMDKPLPAGLEGKYRQALGVAATDVTGWDRGLSEKMMRAYFFCYLPKFCKGVPKELQFYFYDVTVNSKLYMSDGEIYLKNHGNPSGYMNTLRINTVCLRTLDYAFAHIASGIPIPELDEHRFFEGCGDDTRVHWLTELGEKTCCDEYLKCWRERTSWVVKLEGMIKYDLSKPFEERCYKIPPFISRGVLCYRGKVYTPLVDMNRMLSKLLVKGENLNERLAGITVGMTFWFKLHLEGLVFVPAVDFLIQNFPDLDLYQLDVLFAYRHGEIGELKRNSDLVAPTYDPYGITRCGDSNMARSEASDQQAAELRAKRLKLERLRKQGRSGFTEDDYRRITQEAKYPGTAGLVEQTEREFEAQRDGLDEYADAKARGDLAWQREEQAPAGYRYVTSDEYDDNVASAMGGDRGYINVEGDPTAGMIIRTDDYEGAGPSWADQMDDEEGMDFFTMSVDEFLYGDRYQHQDESSSSRGEPGRGHKGHRHH
jgi:hypothetical protein